MAIKYKHLVPNERILWKRYLDVYAKEFDEYVYDIHLGTGTPGPKEWKPWMKELQKKLTQKRCDVVGYKADEIRIFEIKPYAGLSAIGQLLSYQKLYIRQFEPILPITLAVVTDRITPDMDYLLEKFDIIKHIFPPPIGGIYL